jgi:subtilisin family serine protease
MNLITVMRAVLLACLLSLFGLNAWAAGSLENQLSGLESDVSDFESLVGANVPDPCAKLSDDLAKLEGFKAAIGDIYLDPGLATAGNSADLMRRLTALSKRINRARQLTTRPAAECAGDDIQDLIVGSPASPSCTSDSDCDDGIFCNGDETCDLAPGGGWCQSGLSPCENPAVCDEDKNICHQPDPDDGIGQPSSLWGDLPAANVSPDIPVRTWGPSIAPANNSSDVRVSIILSVEEDKCQEKQPGAPDDAYYKRKKDSWGLRKVGFTASRKSAWNIEDGSSRPVIVAVIDTGLDWNHKDFSKRNIWQNTGEIPGNGKDDDGNGFIDDIIGWNFIANNNKPWDDDGHGTFVAGIIAANSNNKIGIAGINKGAKIMVLKALNAFGHTRSSLVAEAIFYAAANGAKVINISVGGKGMTGAEQDAINYAHKKGALIVMAAGNEAVNTADYSSGLHHVISVVSSDTKNRRAGFSNFGQQVDIAAPGMDIVSLRARRTDLMASVQGIKYRIGKNYVGKDKRYFRASGTSFSAPMVAGAASLIWAKYPRLTNTQVRNMLLNSAKDIETPGWDQLTGAGLLDAAAALKADPDYFTDARIGKVAPVKKNGKLVVEVHGSSLSSDYRDAWLELGFGKKPRKWKKVSKSIRQGISSGRLAAFDAKNITRKGTWTVRLVVKTGKHGKKEARASMDID